jgi:hypothetical protein
MRRRGGRWLAIDGRRASRKVGPGNGRGNLREGKARGLIAIKRDLRKERKARRDGRARPKLRWCTIGRRRGKERERGRRRGGLTGGGSMSATAGKKEKGGGDAGRCGRSLGGLVGRWAE